MKLQRSAMPSDPDPPDLTLLMNVSLQVSARLGMCTLTIGEILALGAGSVIELDRAANEPVDVVVNGRALARGEIVAVDERFGVRITELVTPAA